VSAPFSTFYPPPLYNPSMNKTVKTILITLAIIAAIPFTCCGLPIGISELFAPIRWKYTKEYQPPSGTTNNFEFDSIRFFMTILGDNDYFNNQFEYVAPRTITVYANKNNSDDARVRLLDLTILSSTNGDIYTNSQIELPHMFIFDSPSGDDSYAEWVAPTSVVTDLPSKEVITVTLIFEITRNASSTTHTLIVTFTPERWRDPYHWMPSV